MDSPECRSNKEVFINDIKSFIYFFKIYDIKTINDFLCD